MTIDRDIRVTPGQIVYLQRLVRTRKRELGKKIAKADENRRAGVRIQEAYLNDHMEELNELDRFHETLDAAQAQIQRLMKRRLGLDHA